MKLIIKFDFFKIRTASILLIFIVIMGFCRFFVFTDKAAFTWRWVGNDRRASELGSNVNINTQFQRKGRKYFQIQGGFHSVDSLLPPSKYFQHHPDYFALVDGKRNARQPCLSNPYVRKIVADNLIQLFKNQPELDMLSLGLPDNRYFCECLDCRRLDEKNVPHDQLFSRRVLNFYSSVSEQVHRKFPGVLIRFGFYDVYTAPPGDAKLPENCIPYICHFQDYCNNHSVIDSTCPYNARFREVIKGWGNISNQIFVYEYYYKVNWLGLPWPLVHSIKQDIKWYRQHKVTGFYTQANRQAAGCRLNLYVASKLLMKPQANVNKIVRLFCKDQFGPAWEEMMAYFNCLERGMIDSGLDIPGRGFAFPHAPGVFTPVLLTQCDKTLKKALVKASTGPDRYSSEVQKYCRLMVYTRKCVEFLNLALKALGPENLDVERKNVDMNLVKKALNFGLELENEIRGRADWYRYVLPSPEKSNPYLLIILRRLKEMS